MRFPPSGTARRQRGSSSIWSECWKDNEIEPSTPKAECAISNMPGRMKRENSRPCDYDSRGCRFSKADRMRRRQTQRVPSTVSGCQPCQATLWFPSETHTPVSPQEDDAVVFCQSPQSSRSHISSHAILFFVCNSGNPSHVRKAGDGSRPEVRSFRNFELTLSCLSRKSHPFCISAQSDQI